MQISTWINWIVFAVMCVAALCYWVWRRNRWDPDRHAQIMRNSMDYVSAFMHLDSVDAIDRCHKAVIGLLKREQSSAEDNLYFERIRKIFASRKQVVNVDYKMRYRWQDQDCLILLRVHSISDGDYEAELQIPGRIAATLEHQFGTGEDGKFWCAFMSHAFYD